MSVLTLLRGDSKEIINPDYWKNTPYHFEEGASRAVIIDNDRVYKFSLYPELDPSKKESELYTKAMTKNVHYFFEPIRELFHIGDNLIYVQNKVLPLNITDKEWSIFAEKPLMFMNAYLPHITNTSPYNFAGVLYWTARCIETFGENSTNEFFHFCQDNDIADFHAKNLGFTWYGHPVMFDYAY